jgi:predicted MFS family arabinose efflux permease
MTALRWRSARLALGTASALGLSRFAYGLVLPAMADDLEWSLARAGLMTTVNGLGYLIGAMLTGAVARRVGVAVTFRLGMVLCAVGLATTAASSSYPAMLGGRLAAGFGGAFVFIAGAVMAPTAVYFAGAGLGIVLSSVAIPPLVDQHPGQWPLAWIGLAAAAGLATVVSWPAARSSTVDTSTRRGARVCLLWPIAVAYMLFAAGYIAYITFLSAYLVERHASTTQATLTWAVLGSAVMAAPALWERAIGQRPQQVLALLLGAIAGAASLALLWPNPPTVVISALAYGGTFMAVPAAVTALVRVSTPSERLTETLAAFTVVFAIGQTAGPWLAGLLADLTGPGAALGWTAALCGAGALLAVAAVPYRPSGHRASPRVEARKRSDAGVAGEGVSPGS